MLRAVAPLSPRQSLGLSPMEKSMEPCLAETRTDSSSVIEEMDLDADAN